MTPFAILLISRLLFGLASGVALPAAAGFLWHVRVLSRRGKRRNFYDFIEHVQRRLWVRDVVRRIFSSVIGWKGAFFVFGLSGMVYAVIAYMRLRRLDRFIEKVEERHNPFSSSMVDDIPMLSEDECVALDSSLAEETVSNEEQARFDIACEDYSNRTWLKNSPLSVKFQLLVVTLAHIMTNIGFFTFQNWLEFTCKAV